MNLPNRLTISRILLVPIILLFMLPVPESAIAFVDSVGLQGLSQALSSWSDFIGSLGLYIAGFLFLLASLTDTLDGSIARKRGIVTTLGKFLDPIADKMLISSVLVALLYLGRVGPLAVIVILLREFVVSALRMVASDNGVVISASGLGKAKMVTQIVAILILLFQDLHPYLVPAGQVAVALAVLITLYSGVDYLVRHLGQFRET